MKHITLEACVDSVESAVAAYKGGADRIELCQNLPIGGTTPNPWLFDKVRKHTDIRIHVLIRPRFGDFCYTDDEFELICDAVDAYRSMGADGVVLGLLKTDGSLDTNRMKILMDRCGDMSVTLHRAFDVCKDPFTAMEEAISLGIDTILTSGQENLCIHGKECIRKLVRASKDRISIQVCGGVNAQRIEELYLYTGAPCYHMSGKMVLDSPMIYRKGNVNMGAPGVHEYEIWRTDKEKIKEARQIIEKLQKG